jgi:hypothetical protein
VRVLAFQGRLINGSIDSPLELQPAPSLLHASSSECEYKPGREQHAGAMTTTKAKPYEGKNNRQKPENAFVSGFAEHPG